MGEETVNRRTTTPRGIGAGAFRCRAASSNAVIRRPVEDTSMMMIRNFDLIGKAALYGS